jgi:hypothetical protein
MLSGSRAFSKFLLRTLKYLYFYWFLRNSERVVLAIWVCLEQRLYVLQLFASFGLQPDKLDIEDEGRGWWNDLTKPTGTWNFTRASEREELPR